MNQLYASCPRAFFLWANIIGIQCSETWKYLSNNLGSYYEPLWRTLNPVLLLKCHHALSLRGNEWETFVLLCDGHTLSWSWLQARIDRIADLTYCTIVDLTYCTCIGWSWTNLYACGLRKMGAIYLHVLGMICWDDSNLQFFLQVLRSVFLNVCSFFLLRIWFP